MSKYQKAILANGITLVAESHPHVRSACIGVWVKVGSALEPPSLNGISHFIEHMVFKGTERRTPLEIATVLECLGGDLNAFTDRECTCYHATVLSEHVEIALDVISDLLMRPTFPKLEMERERNVLLQELSMVQESPDDYINDLFFSTVWKDHPLGQTVIGSRKSIKAIHRGQLLRYFKEHYRADNMVISIAGNIDFQKVRDQCERYFVFKPTREPTPEKRKRLAQYQRAQRSIALNTDQMHLMVGFEGVSLKDPFRFDALILSFFLGGGMSSCLFQEIREKAGLAYTVDCDCVPFRESGVFNIYLATSVRSLKKCLEIIGHEIERLKKEPLKAKQLEMVKGQLRGNILLSSEQMETRQESLGRNEIIFGRHVPVEEVIREIDRVSAERVHELTKQMFVREKESIVTLSRDKVSLKGLSVVM